MDEVLVGDWKKDLPEALKFNITRPIHNFVYGWNDDGTAYEKAREGAVTRTRRSARTGTITPGTNFPIERGGGIPLAQVANAAIISEATKQSAEDMVKSAKSFQDRMTSLNRGLMSGTFALGSLSGLASILRGLFGFGLISLMFIIGLCIFQLVLKVHFFAIF